MLRMNVHYQDINCFFILFTLKLSKCLVLSYQVTNLFMAGMYFVISYWRYLLSSALSLRTSDSVYELTTCSLFESTKTGLFTPTGDTSFRGRLSLEQHIYILFKMNKLVGLTRNFSSSSSLNAIKTVTVVGGGLMGSGIAQVS